MKKCELCNSLAKMYCESDLAILCWDCDSRVHGANFLVAKHLRTLLCHLCQSPTPWNGSGPKLGPTVSVCDNCVNRNACREESNNEETHDEEDEDDDDDLDGEDDSEDDDGDNGDDEENQVVPWSSTPPDSSSSTSEECSTRYCSVQEGTSQSRTVLSLKRMRETEEPASRQADDPGCSFSPQHQTQNLSNESASFDPFRSLKDQKITARDFLKRLQKGVVAGDI
ncbi:PREDICTED: zinc finger protein CONSTANS-LIKE 4 isoform X1 [Theobroma cacao]|uniref:Zinc finger protein CONSTANS-LIKE 4 isoform X1 n=1 Tax=Theobroma cacao TaxID=3641 RepID=A0AB32WFY7_THECC|nr:PREDICTED: zinc finger protein CONSTANS-LIKE 4 isoform X1 [Theobroma cacao]